MTSPSPARSKTTPSSGKLSAGRIGTRDSGRQVYCTYRFHLLGVETVGWFAFAFGTASTGHTAAEN